MSQNPDTPNKNPELNQQTLVESKSFLTSPGGTDITQLLKHYTDQFWSGITKTNTTLLAWIVALLLITFTVLLPLSRELKQANKKLDRIVRLNQERSDKLKKQAESSDNVATAQMDLALSDYNKRIEAARKDYRKSLARVTDVPLPPPLNKLSIRIPYVPLAWSIVFAGLIAFFLYRRTVALALLIQIVHIQMVQNKKRVRDLRGMGSWAPFWLAPLPKVAVHGQKTFMEGRRLNRALRQMLGWNLGLARRYWLMFLFFGVALTLCIWVVWIAFTLDSILDDSYHLRGIAVLVIIIGCVVACSYWLRPPIRFGGYPEKLLPHSRGRRSFLWVAGAGVTAGIAYALIPAELWRYLVPRPRFIESMVVRYEPAPTQIQNSFQSNKQSHIVHFIGEDDRVLKRTKLKLKNLESKDTATLTTELLKTAPQKDTSEDQRAPTPVAVPAPILPPSADESKPVPEPEPISEEPSESQEITPSAETKPTVNTQVTPVRREESKVAQPERVVAAPEPLEGRPEARNATQQSDVKLTKRSTEENKPLRFSRNQAGTLSERLALDLVSKGQIDKAIEVLWIGIRDDTGLKKKTGTPSYRLYDLVIALAARTKNLQSEIKKATEYIDSVWAKDRVLQQRIRSWSKPSKRRNTRWQASNLKWAYPPTPKEEKTRVRGSKIGTR